MAGGEDPFRSVPPEEEQAALLDSLEELCRTLGAEAFGSAPLILPTPKFFPGLGESAMDVALFSEGAAEDPFPTGLTRSHEGTAALSKPG